MGQRCRHRELGAESQIVIVTTADILTALFVVALGLFYAELIASAEPDPLSEAATDPPALSA